MGGSLRRVYGFARPRSVRRERQLERLRHEVEWDLVIVGGGATGVGIAVDAAARGYRVALVEQADFGKGTSSRSTKLIHGGVRYLKQGNVSLVMEALKERGILRRNAPHLVRDLAFVVPNYSWWEAPFYGIGMKVYDALAGRYGFAKSRHLTKDAVIERIPTIERDGLRGGVLYYDAQFDDARLLINLVRTAYELGASIVNYVRAVQFVRDDEGFLEGVVVQDVESSETWVLRCRCVVNAAGPFSDQVRRIDQSDASPLLAASQGVHIVLDRSFLPGDAAIMVPRTDDGRVLFAIPWHDRVLIGTTDTPIDQVSLEPRAFPEEIEFLLQTAASYLTRDPTPSDVRSVFAGIRPLARAAGADETAALSRDHAIHISKSGLLSITGGKWTTYRRMAEDVVDHVATLAGLPQRACPTAGLNIHGHHPNPDCLGRWRFYGSDAVEVAELCTSNPDWSLPIHPELEILAGEVVWAVRHEMARTIDDVLARRTRCLLTHARAAMECASAVARLMADELGRDATWCDREVEAFLANARGYALE